MARDGSGVYSAPAGTLATPNTTIESSKYNAFVNDLVQDANTDRPIVAGGTGASTAVDAHDAFSTKGSNIASATTTDIGAATGRYVHITGTTTITGFGTKTAGVVRILTFDGALTLTHNGTSLILPGGANITTAAGDTAVMVSEGSGNWRCVSYQRASGGIITSATQAEMEAASSLTVPVTPGRMQYHPGVAKAWASVNQTGTQAVRASYGVFSITDGGVGNTQLNFSTNFSSNEYCSVGMCDNATAVIVVETSKNSTAFAFRCLDTSFAAADAAVVNVVCFGDQ